MNKNRFRLKESLKFYLERQFIKGAHYQLLFVAALIGLISLVGGVLVMPLGEPTDGFGESIWWAFLRLSDPGYLGDDEGFWRRFVSTILTVLGYVVFLGSMVAIITTWLNLKIRNLEQGLTPVTATNHILILGWNSKVIFTAGVIFGSVNRLRRFLKFYGARKLKLIILADDVTPDHLQELKDNPLIGKGADEIILRSGISIDREHLRRVDCLNASAIIIPSSSQKGRELITPDVETIKTLLSINAEALNTKGISRLPYIVAEIQDDNKIKAAYSAYSGQLEVIGSNTIISRLLAQNIRHSGLSLIYNEILNHIFKNNIFSREYPEADGKSINELKSAFPKAIIIGIVRQENEQLIPMLNLPSNFKIQPNDKLVFIARKSADIEYHTKNLVANLPTIKPVHRLKIEKHKETVKLLILGWNHHISALINELCTYKHEYYDITIVAVYPKEKRELELKELINISSRVKWHHIEADYVKETVLKSINPSIFDNVLLVSSERVLDKEEADARTIVGHVLLEEVLDIAVKKPRILLELSDPDNEMLLRKYKSEAIISPLILSNLLAGTALQRELNSIFRELFTVGGAEIIFRTPKEYDIKTSELSFAELEEQAIMYGETALGFYFDDENIHHSLKLFLNPERKEIIIVKPVTKFVVLTTIY